MVRHGSFAREEATSLATPVTATATLPVVFGTAPINLAESLENVNKPVIAYSMTEFTKAFGNSTDWKNYTLCEMADAAFRQFNIAPVVFVNVLDPTVHKASKTESIDVAEGKATITTKGVLLKSLVVNYGEAELKVDEDYIASFDSSGQVVIALVATATSLNVDYDHLTPEDVTSNEIIGGYDVATGKNTGLELLNTVFPKFGMVPGLVLAPKFSKDPTVAAVMRAKASSINKYFKSFSLDDANTKEANVYTKVNEWKNSNSYTGTNESTCWPLIGLGERVYHLSTQIACRIVKTAAERGGYPDDSPSNLPLQMDRMLVEKADGTYEEVDLGPDQSELLNNQGIITALNFMGGWKAWGNNTAAFPGTTDVKDSFINVRLMHNYIANTIILTTWSKVDRKISTRIIDQILDTMNLWLNGLHGEDVILGGRVEFRQEDNSEADFLAGKVRFRYFVAESTPMQEIDNILEFDATYYSNLFGAA